MPVIYGDFNLVPVSTVSLSESKQTLGDGRAVSTLYNITVKGTIVPDKLNYVLSPLPTDGKMSQILRSQQEMRAKVGNPGKLLQIQGWDGITTAQYNVREVQLEFEEGPWIDKCDYVITFVSAQLGNDPVANENIDSASENWAFDAGELPRTTKVSHVVQAKGNTIYDANGVIAKKAWEYAKDFVINRLGMGYTTQIATWSSQSGRDLATISAHKPLAIDPYDYYVIEAINETEGTYEATETWTLAPHNYVEEITATVRRQDDQPTATVFVSLTGTITGLYVAQNDFEARYTAALAHWNAIQTQIYGRASAYTSATLNSHPIASSVDHDNLNGKISFQFEFSNRAIVNDTIELYSVASHVSSEDYKTTVSISGTITGVLYLDQDTDPLLRVSRAQAQWTQVQGLLLSRAIMASGITDLQAFPVQAEFTANQADGTVSYTYEFDNRIPAAVRDEYTIQKHFSRDDGLTVITIEGTITGLRTDTPFATADLEARYRNATSYWHGKATQMLSLATLYVDYAYINPTPQSTSESHNPLAAVVTYQYEFTSKAPPCTPGALSEVVTITEDDAVPVIAQFVIPGKKDGPVIQDINTTTAKKRSVSIEVVFPLPSNPCGALSIPRVDVGRYQPAGTIVRQESGQSIWVVNLGRYSRQVAWIYV